MRLGILGSLLVSEHGDSCAPRAPKQRHLLAFLLLHANDVVTFSECVDELWPTNLPTSVVPTLQSYVMHLRKALAAAGRADRLVTRGRGYSFLAEPGELDLDVFEELMAASRRALAEDDDPRATALLADALALWRGDPLSGIAAGPVLRTRSAELRERRDSAIEQRIDVDLRLGRHHELLGELAALVERHPWREHLAGQYMLALYRSGRQVRALEVYRRLRGLLAERHGLEPAVAVRRLHRHVLALDPRLDVPVRPGGGLALDLLSPAS